MLARLARWLRVLGWDTRLDPELPDPGIVALANAEGRILLTRDRHLLRELRPSDLDGSAGLYRLKEELTRRVNVAIAPSRINAVLFKEIIVQ